MRAASLAAHLLRRSHSLRLSTSAVTFFKPRLPVLHATTLSSRTRKTPSISVSCRCLSTSQPTEGLTISGENNESERNSSTPAHLTLDSSDMPAHTPRIFNAAVHSVVPASSAPLPASSAVSFSHLIFLGTGSAIPNTVRNTAALCIQLSNGSCILLDCGEGTQQQLMRAASIKLGRIDAILITHLHGDHCFGLPGLLCTLGACGRTAPLPIVGPPALRSMVEAMLAGAGGFDAFPLHFLPIEEGVEHDCGLIAGVHVQAAPLLHTIPSFAYTLTESTRAGPLLADKAKSLGVSGKDLGRLKLGEDVTNSRGEVVRAAECVGPSPPPMRVSLVQDTYDCSAAYSQLQGVDVLIHESTYDASMAEKAVVHGHSTAAQAGRVAADVEARMLILTHFSARYGAGKRNRQEIVSKQQQAHNTAADATTHTSEQREEERAHEAEAEEHKVDAALPSSSVFNTTTDDLVQEAENAYMLTKGVDASACIPVRAAEDFLVLERHGHVFQVKGYDCVLSKQPSDGTVVAD